MGKMGREGQHFLWAQSNMLVFNIYSQDMFFNVHTGNVLLKIISVLFCCFALIFMIIFVLFLD